MEKKKALWWNRCQLYELNNCKMSESENQKHRKWQFITQEPSGGNRLKVRGEQKLDKPPQSRRGAPPSGCTFWRQMGLSAPSSACRGAQFVCVVVFSYIPLSSLNAFQFVLNINQNVTFTFSVYLLKTLFTILGYSAYCLGKGLSKQLQLRQHKPHLKSFKSSRPVISAFSPAE